MCDHIKTLLYPENQELIDRSLIINFLRALLCPNDFAGSYDDMEYHSDKQLYMMWVLQEAKDQKMFVQSQF